MIAIDIIRSMQRPELHEQQISIASPSKRIVPGPYDVICARGKQAYNHEGVSATPCFQYPDTPITTSTVFRSQFHLLSLQIAEPILPTNYSTNNREIFEGWEQITTIDDRHGRCGCDSSQGERLSSQKQQGGMGRVHRSHVSRKGRSTLSKCIGLPV